MYKLFTIITFVVYLSTSAVFSQSFEQTYNRFQNVSDRLVEVNKTDDVLSTSDEIDDLITETKSIIRSFQNLNGVKDDYRLAAGYYNVLSTLKLAEIYDAGLDYELSYQTLKRVTPYINGTVSIPFPIYFKISGTQYQITTDNMLALKNQYYSLMQYLTYYSAKYEELEQTVKSQIQLNSNHVSIVQGLVRLFDAEKSKFLNFTPDQKVLYYSSFLFSYSRLTEKEFASVSKTKEYVQWFTVASNLLTTINSIAVSNTNTTQIAKALVAISEKSNHSEALIDLAQYTLTNYFQTSDYQGNIFAFNISTDPYNYYQALEKVAWNTMLATQPSTDLMTTAMNMLATSEKEKAKKLALATLTKMGDYAVSKNLCEKIQLTAESFKKWEYTAEYTKYNALVLPCQLAVKKENERKARELKRANSKTNIYLGAYPLGLLTKAEKMDFGAALNFVTAGKGALELSFLKIQQKRDNYFDIWMMEKKYKAEDLSLWDGYYAHVQYKIFNNSGKSGLYNGILLGYSDKDFEPMTVKTVDISTNAEKDELFDPTLNQTILMLNEGFMGLYKGIGYDVFFGVGATYNRYNSGNTTYNSTTHNIVNNNVLQFRKKEYFSFIMRFGVTVGLNIGNGNRK